MTEEQLAFDIEGMIHEAAVAAAPKWTGAPLHFTTKYHSPAELDAAFEHWHFLHAHDKTHIKRLGKTLKQWREAFLAYFDTGRASNGGTEAINGLIELHRRVARGFRDRDHYRLRMLLIGGGLAHPHLR